MNYNIVLEYTNFIKKEIIKFYKIVLGKEFDKNLVELLLNRYILIRYYNETNYKDELDLIERLSKELQDIINPIINEENKEQVKNIYSLFGYISYFDDCYFVENYKELLDCFFEDKNIKINFTEEMKKEVTAFIRKFNKNKDRFYNVFHSNQFFIKEKGIKKNLYKITLGHNVRISNLYSDYAIEKAFNTGTINEDKMFVQLIMTSQLILQNTIGLDFSRYYIIDFIPSFFTKEKKIERIFNVIDNNLTKKHLILNVTYENYILYKEKVEEFIKRGFSFSLSIDHTFDEDFSNFILFSYAFLYRDNEFYDIIIENKEQIMSNLIIL